MDLLSPRWVPALLIAVALAGTTALYAYALSQGPRDLSIDQIDPQDAGGMVRTQGLVASPRGLTNGGLTFGLVAPDSGETIRVYIPGEVFAPMPQRSGVVPGALVEITGEVQEFRGYLEIVVEEGRALRVLQPPGETRLPLGYLAAHPDAFEGMFVVIEGRFSDPRVQGGPWNPLTLFTIQATEDGTTYRIRGVVYRWNWTTDDGGIDDGDRVEFRGVVSYYAPEAQWQVTAEGPGAVTHARH